MIPDPDVLPRVPGGGYNFPVTTRLRSGGMALSHRPPSGDKPYPAHWEQVAEIRVLRAPATDWDKLSVWGTDMRKRGWRLLQVNSDAGQIVAVFGKSRQGHTRDVP